MSQLEVFKELKLSNVYSRTVDDLTNEAVEAIRKIKKEKSELEIFVKDLKTELGLGSEVSLTGSDLFNMLAKVRTLKLGRISEMQAEANKKPKIEKAYDSKGNAKHYAGSRINAINKYERVYGTLATMTFCEITADKYRERIGKKEGQSVEQEALKISWYEKASAHYFKKLGTPDEIVVDNRRAFDLPWEK